VFRDATENANAARPPEVDKDPPDTVPIATNEQALSLYATEAARAYADAFGKWQKCVEFYEGLRNEQSD
jgi:hypothetical protein